MNNSPLSRCETQDIKSRYRSADFLSGIDGASEKEIERQADGFALNAFVSEQEWDQLSSLSYAEEIKAAAKRLAIHPAIIAGRLRREANDYRKHRTLIGQGRVKELFALP